MAKFSESTQIVLEILADKPVAYHPKLAKAVGGVKQAIFVSQLLYWNGKGKDAEGWIYKTQDEITEETGLSRHETDTVRTSLKATGILEEKLKRVPATVHYRLSMNNLYTQIAITYQSSLPENGKLDCQEAANLFEEKRQSLIESEITQESTPEKKATPEKTKPGKLDFVDLLLAQASSPQVIARKEIRARVTAALGLTPNWDSEVRHMNWKGLEAFLMAEDKQGRKIETWASWYKSDAFRANNIVNLTPEKIRTAWGLAFTNQQPAHGQPTINNRPLPKGV